MRNKRLGKRFRAVVFLALFFAAAPSHSQFIVFKEQYYRLFHMHLQRSPDNFIENIFWLEQALRADFANPLHALALIETEIQWEKYRYLFMMQINLKLTEQYMFLASMWSRRRANFFNAPWREQNLESLDIAENTFHAALYYWEAAQEWAALARDRRFRFVELPRVQFWVDSAYRIEIGELNFGRTIRRELAHIETMREQFRAMPDPVPWELPPSPAFPW